ncbi:hypothetical protein [Sphingobacterium chungjuense]|uniref:hypothetical protein n=1 Tax=Sphingobacterium chungjuense TaxID=2675553 RepID=UPI00140B7F79|nr:hypothetical protein [Sphingobacterium chungjuense]
MKKSEKKIKVKLHLPQQVLNKILSSNLNRFEQAKYLLFAQYYYNSDTIVNASTLNKYLGIKDSKGKDIRLDMLGMGIIVSTDRASYVKDSNGQFYRKGYDMYIGTYQTAKVGYTLLSSDARSLIGNYGIELMELLDVIALPASEKDIAKYEQNKIKYTKVDESPITGDLLKIIEQNMNEINKNAEGDNMANGHVNNENTEDDNIINTIMANLANAGVANDVPTPIVEDVITSLSKQEEVQVTVEGKPVDINNDYLIPDDGFNPTVAWGDNTMSLEEALRDFDN